MLRRRSPAVAIVALVIALLGGPELAAQTTISTDGVIESTSGGFKFPDGSVQTTAGDGTMRAPVPATGQQLCYDDAGGTIACAGTGQDGEIQAGVPWPVPRFTDSLDGTVTDNLTGLIWLRDAGCTAVGPELGYVDAVNAANTLADGLCGLTDGSVAGDWRLPNIREILSVVDFSQSLEDPHPLPGGHPFQNVGSGNAFWTSTTWKNSFTSVIQYSSGELSDGSKSNSQRFWAVRGGLSSLASVPAPVADTGQVNCYSPDPAANGNEIPCRGSGLDGEYQAGVASPSPRFTDNGDGTVTDNLTGLIWLRDAECSEIGDITFGAALAAVATVADGVCDLSDGSSAGDWRMPNINEYLSLIDFGRPSSFPTYGLPPGHPFVNFTGWEYWSSTTSAADPDRAHFFSGEQGDIGDYEKAGETITIWPVRGPE